LQFFEHIGLELTGCPIRRQVSFVKVIASFSWLLTAFLFCF
jgi:hypothetical protein